MSTDPVLPAVHSPSGLLHLAPDDTLWRIFQYPDSDRLLIRRYDAQDRALPDWHLDQAGYDDYRARHPQIGLPDLGAPSEAESAPAGEPGTAEVETRHIAHAGSWSATSIEPDWCEVCGEAVPFDSHADLSAPVRASPNVKARGTPVYAISHIGRGVQGSVGEGLESGTSGATGHVQILSGQTDVKVNGLMVGRHDSLALINCNAQGCGGALAQLQVSFKPTSAIDQVGRELSMTPAELRQRMAQYREGQAAANARADAFDRQIAELRRQADQASSWNPLNAERRAIARQIRSLQASQRSAASSALWYGEQALRIVERLHPETIGMPGISATPDPQEARELARRQADIERGWAVIDARRRGFGGALASMAGAPPELADAVNGFTSFGRGQTLRPVSQAALPRRRPRTIAPAQAPQQPQQPAPGAARARPSAATPPPRPGVYVRPKRASAKLTVRAFDNIDAFNRAAQNPLPNSRYEFGGNAWTTDSRGRVVEIEGRVMPTSGGPRYHTPGTLSQAELGKVPGAQPGDVGFHLIGHRFGGPINPLNVLPGNGRPLRVDPGGRLPNINQGRYSSEFEAAVARIGRETGAPVPVRISVSYGAGNTTVRPDAFIARYQRPDGRWERLPDFFNRAGG